MTAPEDDIIDEIKRFITLSGLAILSAICGPSVPALAQLLTPPPPAAPRINWPRVYGERVGKPFLFTIPATGDEPISYQAAGLPGGLFLNAKSGHITGSVQAAGTYDVLLTASNAKGHDSKTLRIMIGNQIALTPPMGWNSWNCFAGAVDQAKVAATAKAMVDTGLIRHGWSYINIDDTWQGIRLATGDHALQPNRKFPDMKKLCDDLHSMGLKAGIYSTPWVMSYAGYCGGSSDFEDGNWDKKQYKTAYGSGWRAGKYSFSRADAGQFAAWGFDYLKYDWHPITVAQSKEMAAVLLGCGRDVVFSLSNRASIHDAAGLEDISNGWRTTGDITDTWGSMTSNGFSQNDWASFSGPGHWNDPDMLVLGKIGWGAGLHPTRLTPNEEYTHMTLWSLLSAPLLIGCDVTQLDAFTLGLLSNDEVIAIDQDSLGRQARRILRGSNGTGQQTEVWAKDLADGSKAVGLFNRGIVPQTVAVHWKELGLSGKQTFRDLWSQTDMGVFDSGYATEVGGHGAVLLRISQIPSSP